MVGKGATLAFVGGTTVNTFTLDGDTFSGDGTTLLAGGVLQIAGSSTIASAFAQTGGTIDVTDTTGTLTISGPATFSGPGYDQETGWGTTVLTGATTDTGAIALDGGRTLRNEGAFTVTTGGAFYLGINEYGKQEGSGFIGNYGTFNIQAPTTFNINAGSVDAVFKNFGTLKQTITTGTTNIGVEFDNDDRVEVETGTLQFSAGGSSGDDPVGTPEMTVAGGAVLEFASSAFSLTNTPIDGDGETLVSGCTLGIGKDVTIASSFELLNGTLGFATGGSLNLVGINKFVGGTISGLGTISADGPTTVSGLTIDSGFFDQGPVTENGGSTTVGDDLAFLKILSTGTWNITDDSGFYGGSSVSSSIDNDGLLEKDRGREYRWHERDRPGGR
jgi:hypothetical protein